MLTKNTQVFSETADILYVTKNRTTFSFIITKGIKMEHIENNEDLELELLRERYAVIEEIDDLQSRLEEIERSLSDIRNNK